MQDKRRKTFTAEALPGQKTPRTRKDAKKKDKKTRKITEVKGKRKKGEPSEAPLGVASRSDNHIVGKRDSLSGLDFAL